MKYIHQTANSKADGRLVREPVLIVEPEREFWGTSHFDDLDYFMYRKYGWKWAENPEHKLEIMNNTTGEKCEADATFVMQLTTRKVDFEQEPGKTFKQWAEAYKKEAV